MMTMKEAQQKTNAYLTKTARTILSEIEAAICAQADRGSTYVDHTFKPEHVGKVMSKVLAILGDAGYHLRWMNNGSLRISWEG